MRIIRKNIKIITIFLIVIILISTLSIKYYLLQKKKKINTLNTEENIIKDNALEKKEEENSIKKIHVDIKGAVKKPGVYEVEEDKLVIDVINIAEGLTDKADTTLINLAKKVSNEMVIIIYTTEEVKKAMEENNTSSIAKIIDKKCICPEIKNDGCISNSNNSKIENKTNTSNNKTNSQTKDTTTKTSIININTATKEELETISGIGSSKADAIISYREENGEFSSIEDIKNVPGIGESLYEKIKDYITI